MEQIDQNNDWRGVARSYSTLSPETEKLLVKYLKMQISAMYWNGFTKFLIVVLAIGSTIFSIVKLAPFIEEQLKAYQSMQPLFSNAAGVALPNQDTNQSGDIQKYIDQLSPDQKQSLIDSFDK